MEEILPKFEELRSLFDQEKMDVARASKLAKELRLKMLKIPFLTPNDADTKPEDKAILRSILEMSAEVSIMEDNIKLFLRIMEELKISYFQHKDLERSEHMEIIFGLYLVALLAQNQLVEFNLEYEAILPLASPDSAPLQYARALANAVTDNSFSRIFQLKNDAPSDLFENITKSILDGARESHADSIQSAYSELTIMELAQILHFRSAEESIAFAEKRGWKLNEQKTAVYFRKEEVRQMLDHNSFEKSIGFCVTVSALA